MSTLDFNKMLVNNAEFLKPFAVTLTRDNEAAKDLYQETLFRALANKDKYNVGTNIKAWLYTIMRNIFINNYRRKAKQATILDNSENEFLINLNQGAVHNEAIAKINKDKRVFKDAKTDSTGKKHKLEIGILIKRLQNFLVILL